MPYAGAGKKKRRPSTGLGSVIAPVYHRVEGEGPVPAKIMFIGERPGENEAVRGRPFIGAAGQILDRCLESAQIRREEIYVTNLVKDYREYEKPTAEEIAGGIEDLVGEILAVQPQVIATLGTFATEAILGWERAGLDKNHGVPVWARNDVVGQNFKGLVVPCFHPAAGLYDSHNFALAAADIVSVGMVADGLILPPEDLVIEDYSIDPHPDSGIGECAVDTEGSFRRPWCLTFSIRPGHARLIHPGHSPQFLRRIWLHNSLHDLAVLRAMGIEIEDGQFTDTMVLAYLLQLEPQGLKALAYRHAGMEMDSYEEIIHEADYDKAMEYLLELEARGDEWPNAEPYTIIEGGVAKVKKPQPIARRVSNILRDVRSGKVNKAGDETDPRDRWHKIDDVLKRPVEEIVGPMPEATLDDVPYDIALRYACRDADATLRIAPVLEAKIDEMGLRGVAEIDHAIIPMIDRMQEVGIGLAPKSKWDELEGECDQIMGKARFRIFQLTGAEINPDSGDQVAELLYGQLGIVPPKMTKGGDRGSTIDKALETIRTHRDIVDLVLDYREASKVVSSFVSPLRAIVTRPESDSRVHCNFRITRVVTGRLAATHPNMLAIPVRSELGKRIRENFVPSQGNVLGEWDLGQIEMGYMADESQDPLLCQIFREGKVDIHRQTAAWTFGCSYGNVLPEQRYAAKRVGFGVITGITGYGLVDQMNLARARRPDGEPWTEDDCDQMIEEWFKIYGRVRKYMDQAGDEAYATGMARDRWGRIRYLPAVWSPIPRVSAEARRQASSFKIQAGAQGLMKRAMAMIWKYICRPRYAEPLLQVHDSMLFEVPDDDGMKGFVSEAVVGHLTETTKLTVPVKAKGSYGRTWAECKD